MTRIERGDPCRCACLRYYRWLLHAAKNWRVAA